MVVPALIYVAVAATGGGSLRGWAIPTATDIAFALAILAVHQHPPAGRAAHVPAHPGRGRRPARDHGDRGLLHRGPRPRLPGSGACCRSRPSRSWCSGGCSRRTCSFPLAAVAWALVHASGRARDRGGRAAGVHGPGAAPRRPDRRARAGRAARAPGPADLGGVRGAGLRLLRLRGRRSAESTACSESLRDPVALGVVAGAGRSARRSESRARPGCWRPSPGPISTTTWSGSTSSGCRCSPASVSRCRC